ncbi:MAG TPA: hypothetical protein VF894_13550 [Anaeromyxobacter sp.]
MRVLGLVLLASVAGGCTSVKMVQRDGCWVRRTEKIFGRVVEDVGPCVRAQPKWVEDRLTRLVQECVAQADYRWQSRAMEAWSNRAPYPAQPPQQEILHTCMEEARVGLVTENETLRSRLAETTGDREALRQQTAQDHAQLRASHDRIAQLLGDAAQKPAGTAVATATSTSDGKASNESGATLASESGSAPPALFTPETSPTLPAAARPDKAAATPPDRPAAAPPAAPKIAPARVKEVRARRSAAIVQAARRDGCEVPRSARCDPPPPDAAPSEAAPAPAPAPAPR